MIRVLSGVGIFAWVVVVCACIATMPTLALASRSDAREMLVSGDRLPEAVNELSSMAKSATDGVLVSEYALALASNGLVSGALSEMDRAFVLSGGVDDGVLYAGSVLLTWLGLTQAAEEISRPAPDWVGARKLALLSKSRKRSDVLAPMSAFGPELYRASELMSKARFITALDRFARLTAVYPKEPLGWSGYSVALEKVGAYKTASKAAAMELALSPGLDTDARGLIADHISELDAHSPLVQKKLNESLQGRYTAYIGGSLNGASGATSTYAVSGQLGKFFTNNVNLSLDASYSSAFHAIAGLGGRFYLPIPIRVPLSLTLGTRAEYDSIPSSGTSNLGFIVSPGISYFIGAGSFDVFFDIGVAGAQKGTETLSVGYTFLIGGNT
jgi:hypothetical protein